MLEEYDLYGRLISEKSYDSENVLQICTAYEYDDQGRLLTESEEVYTSENELSYRVTCVYDKQGRLLTESTEDLALPSGQSDITTQYYNENQQLIREVIYSDLDEALDPITITFTYQYQGVQANIDGTVVLNNGSTGHVAHTYLMDAPENYVHVNPYGWGYSGVENIDADVSIGGLEEHRVKKREVGNDSFRFYWELCKSVEFDSDGNVIEVVEYEEDDAPWGPLSKTVSNKEMDV